jgi:hypothetical protein
MEAVAQDAFGVAQPVQEAQLEEGRPRLFHAQLVLEFRQECAQELLVQQQARLVEKLGLRTNAECCEQAVCRPTVPCLAQCVSAPVQLSMNS